MAIWSKFGLSGPAAGAGAAVVAVIAVGGYVVYDRTQGPIAPPQPQQVVAAPQSAPKATPEPTPPPEQIATAVVEQDETPSDPMPEEVAETPTPAAAQPTPEPEPEPEPQAAPNPPRPAFDVVSVQPDGSGVLAGRAVPGRPVVFYLDGEEFSRASADAAGKFGLVLDFPASDMPRSLSMASLLEDGTAWPSDGVLLISPTRAPVPEPEPEVAPKEAEPAPQIAAAPEPEPAPQIATAPEPEPQIAAVPEPKPEPKPEPEPPVEVATLPAAEPVDTAPDAPAIVLATEDDITVIQPAPQPAAPQPRPAGTARDAAPVVANVVIDTITYDSSGDVALAGRGASSGFVRVYLNDRPVKTSEIAEDGSWSAPLPDVDAGVYRLRVDEVAADGAVTSRVETPFQREEPDVVASADTGPLAVTVQPGFTLWAIARDTFGSGEQYVRVYEANRDLIRDPNLIYPGQVFALPEG